MRALLVSVVIAACVDSSDSSTGEPDPARCDDVCDEVLDDGSVDVWCNDATVFMRDYQYGVSCSDERYETTCQPANNAVALHTCERGCRPDAADSKFLDGWQTYQQWLMSAGPESMCQTPP